MSNRKIIILCLLFVSTGAIAGNPVLLQQNCLNKNWSFAENKGQLTDPSGNLSPEIKYYGYSSGISLYCMPGMISFVFTKIKSDKNISEATGHPLSQSRGCENPKISTSRVELVLFNSNKAASIIPSGEQDYYENYYLAHTGQSGIINVHTFKTITYKNIYPHIDLVLHAKVQGLKYEFVVNPGGKVNDIQMQWNGLNSLKLLDNGGLSYQCALGKMDEGQPVSYQDKNLIKSRFMMKQNRISFKVDLYNKSRTLILDPVLIWGTYFGGTSADRSYDIKTDVFSDVYITGITTSITGIATKGAYQASQNGNYDIFIAKFKSNGNLLWATYYGGEEGDEAARIALDPAGNIYITGTTSSTYGIATPGAYKSNFISNGYADAFLAKFDNYGYRKWATYFGGSDHDKGTGVYADGQGFVYMTGATYSTKGIATSNAYQKVLVGGFGGDAFLAKFDVKGKIQWATYFGGADDDFAKTILADQQGNVFCCGYSLSKTGIATNGAYQTSMAGYEDAFLAEFSSAGILKWSTYFGGTNSDDGADLLLDNSGNIYLAGSTGSISGISTKGAFQTSFAGGTSDAFLAKFNNNGNLQWSTYYGTDQNDYCQRIALDTNGNIYMSGYSFSITGLATKGAYQTSNIGSGTNDAFLAKFNENGLRLWSTYFGGSEEDLSWGVAADRLGNIYLSGYTTSDSHIATSGGYRTSYSNNTDVFLAKFNNTPVVDAGIIGIISPVDSVCPGGYTVKVKLKNFSKIQLNAVTVFCSINGKTSSPYLWAGKLSVNGVININIGYFRLPPGTDTIKCWTFSPNGITDSVPQNDTTINIIKVFSLPDANAGPDTTLCYNQVYTMQGSGGVRYTWYPATYLSSATDPSAKAVLPNTQHYLLVVKNTRGCSDTARVLMKVRPKLKVHLSASKIHACIGDTVTITAQGTGGDKLHYDYTWPYDAKAHNERIINGTKSGWHKVILNDNCTPVSASDSIYITFFESPIADFTINPLSPVKINKAINFLNRSSNAKTYYWTFGTKFTSNLASPRYFYIDTGQYKVMLVAYGSGGCPNDTIYSYVDIIGEKFVVYIPNSFTPNGDGKNDFFEISGSGIKSYYCTIYNRWGELIFENKPAFQTVSGTVEWDGSFIGSQVPEGIYLYQLKVIDLDNNPHYLSGTITVLR
jgi:gliding motility-associated-like protein